MTDVEELTAVPLAQRTTLRLGGAAARLVVARTEQEVIAAISTADAAGEPVLVLGSGSNVVVADDGFPGLVVVVATAGIEGIDGGIEGSPQGGDQVVVTAAAGVDWDGLVARCVERGLAGIEALSGIPGLVGAAPIQNIGAYGQEVADTVVGIRVLDRRTGTVTNLAAAEAVFTYRGSVFKARSSHVVLAVTFALTPGGQGGPVRYAELAGELGVELGERAPVSAVRSAVRRLRARKGMLLDAEDHDTWSAGSFFTNPVLPAEAAAALPSEAPRWPADDGAVKVSAAWLIEHSGYGRGYGAGRVRVSGKHTLALTNRGGARTEDLLALAREIRAGVQERFGVELGPEPVLIGCAL